MRIFMVPVVLSSLGAVDVNAAPSVKRLGVNNSDSLKTTTLSSKTSSGVRSGSIRSNKMPSVKKGDVKKTVSTDVSRPADSDQRLSVGKYLHTTGVNSGVIKPVVSVETVAAASNDIVSLSDKISDLKTVVDKKQDVLTSENVVFSGEGVIVTSVSADNGTVVVNKGEITIPVGAPESTNRAKVWIE